MDSISPLIITYVDWKALIFSTPLKVKVDAASNPNPDEAFGYLKRVIVTPAVYPRLVE